VVIGAGALLLIVVLAVVVALVLTRLERKG